MVTDTSASYATPPRSDADNEDVEKINKEPSRASAEIQTSTYNPMFITDDDQLPPPATRPTTAPTMTEPHANMQLINASEKRDMALDNIETVLTSEMDERAVAVLQAARFDTYWVKTQSGGYKRTTYLKDIKKGAEYAADAWRVSDHDVRKAQVAFQKTKSNPVDFLAARNTLHMARMEMESRREIRHAEDANYEAHVNKAQRLLAQRKKEEAEAWEAEVERKQEAKRAKLERKDQELLQKSQKRIRNGRVSKRR